MARRPVLYFLCTGNAARSVMAAAMLRGVSDAYEVRTAGTHVVEGRPMSDRTRIALARHDLRDVSHRSHQMTAADVADADLVVAMEPLHVAWVRRHHPGGASITGTIKRLVRDLRPSAFVDPDGEAGSRLRARITALDLGRVDVEPWEELVDPAAGDQAVFDRCADELKALVVGLARALR